MRPLGAVLVYRWLLPPEEEAAAPSASYDAASRATSALAAHPARRGSGSDGAARGLLAHAPLQSGATSLGYCSKGRLLLVGCRSGSAMGSTPPS